MISFEAAWLSVHASEVSLQRRGTTKQKNESGVFWKPLGATRVISEVGRWVLNGVVWDILVRRANADDTPFVEPTMQ